MPVPKYHIVTSYKRIENGGMPGKYPAKAVRVHSDAAIDTAANRVDGPVVRKMLTAGMLKLTGASNERVMTSSRSDFRSTDV